MDFTKETYLIQFYECVVLFNKGIVSNIINIVVSLRKELKNSIMSFYNILMSIFNILTLIFVGYLAFFAQSIGQEQLILRTYLNCILISYFIRIFSQMSSWINVMVTFDRMLCIVFIQKVKFTENKKLLTCIVMAIFTLISVINSPNLLFKLEINNSTNQTFCTSSNAIISLRDTVAILMRILIPILLQIIMNSILIYKLFKARNNVTISRSLDKEYRFAFTIIILSIISILTELPFIMTTIFINVYGYNQSYISSASNESAIASLAHVCSFLFSSFIYVVLFYVNIITNKLFRKAFRNMFISRNR